MSNSKNTLLNEKEVAQILNVKLKTLQLWRYQGKGPKHLEPNPQFIRYWMSDVVAWLEG